MTSERGHPRQNPANFGGILAGATRQTDRLTPSHRALAVDQYIE